MAWLAVARVVYTACIDAYMLYLIVAFSHQFYRVVGIGPFLLYSRCSLLGNVVLVGDFIWLVINSPCIGENIVVCPVFARRYRSS